MTNLQFSVTPRGAVRGLALVLAPILLGHIAGLISTHVYGHGRLLGLVPLFSLDQEANLPTLYSAMLLATIGLVLAGIARARREAGDRFTRYWVGLSVIFFFLALDEAASIHEMLIELREVYATSGALHFPWVIVYLPLALLFGAVYLRFLANLPRPTAIGMMLAGALYVGGAAGMEMVGGAWAAGHGEINLTYSLITTVEELCEIAGLLLFLHTLLTYTLATGTARALALEVTPDPVREPARASAPVAQVTPALGTIAGAQATRSADS